MAIVNPLAGPDKSLAYWFHAHLNDAFVSILRAFSEFGSGEWIGYTLGILVLFFIWKRSWPSIVSLVIAVPGGMLLNEWMKILVHRPRPFGTGPYVDWSGYSFASGHTIAATLLYGQLVMFILPAAKSRRRRFFALLTAVMLVGMVGFSRIALGAHYLTDVLGAIIFGILWLLLCLVICKMLFRNRSSLASAATVLSEEAAVLTALPLADAAVSSSPLIEVPVEVPSAVAGISGKT